MAFNMFGNHLPAGLYIGHPARLFAKAVVVGLCAWYAYLVSSFGSSYLPRLPNMPAAQQTKYGMGSTDGRGLECLDEAGFGMGRVREWADDTMEMTLRYGSGDAGWMQIHGSVQRAGGRVDSIVTVAQDVRNDMADEQAEFEIAMHDAERQLAEAHRFDEAPDATLGLVNGTFAWAHYACSLANQDCKWTVPFAPRQNDEAITYELIQKLIEIRKKHRHGRQLNLLYNSISGAHSAAADAHHFAVGNWQDRRLATGTCMWSLGRRRCSRMHLAEQTQPELHTSMVAFFDGQRATRRHLQASHDTLWQAKLLDRRLDKWLASELAKVEKNGHGDGDGDAAAVDGWDFVGEARRQVALSLTFVCAKPRL